MQNGPVGYSNPLSRQTDRIEESRPAICFPEAGTRVIYGRQAFVSCPFAARAQCLDATSRFFYPF